ncbi:MAG: ABC transporter ATP-binding protein [Betaproteobacteria bacterium]|nr:ABC transporter ATP-binding protein [Betaproteobacteria bacterium]
MSDSQVLELRNLGIALPAHADRSHAVKGVSLRVARGETLCLVGESGSGKSALALGVMGLLPRGLLIDAGSIRLADEEIAHASAARRRALRATRMAMIFQEPMSALNPVMRCGAQLDEVLTAHTRLAAAQRRAKISALLEEVGLSEPARMLAAYPHQLSGGQRQRIMIAMALLLEPILLIADEPTTALDVSTQAQILALLSQLQARHGMALLFVTHDFGVVAQIADRVALLAQGEIVEQGSKDRLLREPRHDYTRALIAAVPGLVPREAPLDPAMPVVLATHNLSKTYVEGHWPAARRRLHAARDITLELRRGETLGIVGESGSGKSTLARCILRLVEASSGEILVDGENIVALRGAALRPVRRKMQVVFQDPYRSLNPRRRVGAAIIEGPLNYGLTRGAALERARRLLALVRMSPAALERYPHQFSGGERQRLCIARALALEPEILVADEAVSALDVSVQAQVLDLLEEIRARLKLAIVFITHDLRVAARLCDHVAVLSQGRVIEYGTTREVFLAPRHAETQALLAAIPGRGYRFGQLRRPG